MRKLFLFSYLYVVLLLQNVLVALTQWYIFIIYRITNVFKFLFKGTYAKYLIDNETFRVGRKEGEIVIENDQSISRKHAVLTVTVSIHYRTIVK